MPFRDGIGKDAGGERAPDTADAVDGEDIERIVDLTAGLDQLGREEAEDAGHQTDHDRRHRVDVSGGRSDGNQAGHRANPGAEHRRFAGAQPGHGDPGETGGSGGQRRGNECVGGQAVSGQGATGIESVPAEPEQPGADERHRNVVWA